MSDELERELAVYAMHRLQYATTEKMKLSAPLEAIERRFLDIDMRLGRAVDDLFDVMEWLREEKRFAQSDRIRVIAGRLARLRRTFPTERPDLIVVMARSWPDPLREKKSP